MEKSNELMWRKVTYPGIRENMYLVSENGDVYNVISEKILSKSVDKDGYFRVSLSSTNTRKFKLVFVHRLVAYAFVPNPNNYPVVDHLNGKKQSNHYTNLEWVTIRENTLRAERMGLRKVRGENNGNAKYSEEYVRTICEKFEAGWNVRDVYRWGLNDPKAKSTTNPAYYKFIIDLKHKDSWLDVVRDYSYSTDIDSHDRWDPPVPQTSNFKYSEEEIRKICKLLEERNSVIDIVEKITGKRTASSPIYDLVQGIRTGKSWKHISKEYKIDPKLNLSRCYTWDSDIADMVDAGMSKKEIRHAFGIMKASDDQKYADHIDRMVDRYKKFKHISTSQNFIIEFH